MRTTLMMLLALQGCWNGSLTSLTDPDDPTETDDPGGGVDTDTPIPQPEECNGKDDDLDGFVDEDFPDTDGDGIADCLDEDCELALADGFDVSIDDACEAEAGLVEDPWNATIQWQWSGAASDPTLQDVLVTPVIGNLTDTDGNGVIDATDIPDVAVVASRDEDFSDGALVVVAGEDGRERWISHGWSSVGGIAIADIDADGTSNVVGFDSTGRVRAVREDGSDLWTSTFRVEMDYPQATVADLDGDGRPEVIADRYILDGVTGALETALEGVNDTPWRLPAVGDLDQDGRQEVILGRHVFAADGTWLWSAPFAGSSGHWAAILDADYDAGAEVVMVGGGMMSLHDSDGSVMLQVATGDARPSAPCVADFDGDGEPEIAWGASSTLSARELDGTILWTAEISDPSGLAACSGYDVDNDGIYEVLFADENTFWIFDGRSGAPRYSRSGHASGTLWEYPSVADVDADGSAEIVIGSNNFYSPGWGGITVFRHAEDAWLRSGTTWHTHDFAVTNIEEDGTVPARPDPWWQTYNLYRARPAYDGKGPDLTVAITDVCYAGCTEGSKVEIAVQVSNHGPAAARPGTRVALYADDGGFLTPLQSHTIMEPIPPGRALPAFAFELSRASIGTDGLLIRVDDVGDGLGIVDECNEDNNEVRYDDEPCP